MSRPKTPHNSPDPGLDELIAEIRRRVRRKEKGRVFVAIEVLHRLSARTAIGEDEMTEGDYDRLMRKQPEARPTAIEGRR